VLGRSGFPRLFPPNPGMISKPYDRKPENEDRKD
jgi:hypothetical protein